MPAVYVNGQERTYPRGTTYETIVSEFQEEYGNHIALVYFNGKMRELNKKLERDGAIQLITTKDPAGHAAYVRTAIMMLVRAWKQVVPDSSLKVEFTLGNAYFVSVIGKTKITDALLQRLEETMRELVEKNLPIVKKTYPLDDAMALFHHQGMTDKEKLSSATATAPRSTSTAWTATTTTITAICCPPPGMSGSLQSPPIRRDCCSISRRQSTLTSCSPCRTRNGSMIS